MRVPLLVGISVVWIPLAFLFDGVTALLLPVRLATAGGSATDIGLVSFAGLGLAVLVQPAAGMLSDRLRGSLDRRAFIALAAVPALVGLWLLVGTTAIPIAIIGYLILQTAASAVQAGQQTLIPEFIEADARGRAGGIKSAFDVGGAFLAFLVVGTLLSKGDVISAGLLVSLLLGFSLFVMARLVPPVARRPDWPRGQGTRWMPPGFVRLVVARLLFLFGVYVVGRFMLLLVAERLAIEPARAADETGGLLAMFTLVTALAAIPAGALADRHGRAAMMLAGAGLAGLGILAFVPPAGLGGVIVAGTLMSIGTAAFVGANWAATTDLAPAHDSGRLMGLANIGTGGAAASAGLLGPVIDAAGFSPALLVAAAATLVSAVPLVALPRLTTGEEPA